MALVTFKGLVIARMCAVCAIACRVDCRVRQRPPFRADLDAAFVAFLVHLFRRTAFTIVNVVLIRNRAIRRTGFSCRGDDARIDARNSPVDANRRRGDLGLRSHHLAEQVGFSRGSSQSLVCLLVVLHVKLQSSGALLVNNLVHWVDNGLDRVVDAPDGGSHVAGFCSDRDGRDLVLA